MGSKPQEQAGITEKVELHVHLDGAIRPETVLEFGKKRGIKLPADNVEELKKHMCVYDTPGDFWEFLRTFGVFVPCVAGDKEAIFRMAYEFCEDCAKDNITYVEARYNPQILANDAPKPFYAPTTGNVGPRDVVETVLAGFEKGSYDFGITAKTILCCIVDCPEWSMEVLHLCEEFRNRGVVAIDLASGEHESPHDANLPRHLEAFRSARLLGLHRTMHAGEVGDSESVRRAVDLFHTERIGHGYHVLDDPKLYNDLREKDIHFEVCPNSAIRTGSVPEAVQNYELHPAKRFANDGVNFSINRDDPLPFDTSLTDEYDFVTKMGLTQDQLVTCIFNAADNCFAPPDERIGLLKRLSAVYGRTWTPR